MDAKLRPARRPTLKDVANLAGVSTMSASLAIRSGAASAKVSQETRDRILKAAQDLAYRPDARARALRLQKTDVIGFYAGHGFSNVRLPFFAELISGLQEGCEEHAKNLLLHRTSHGAVANEVYRELVSGFVDGLVVAMPAEDPVVAKLALDNLPVIAIADAIPGIPSVVVDDAQGADMIAEHLWNKGHRSAVFATGPTLPYSARRRQREFIERAVYLGMDVTVRSLGHDDELVSFVEFVQRVGATAVVAWNDFDARRLLKVCRAVGISVPGELALTGFDGTLSPFEDPFPLTTVRAPWAEAARRSVDLLQRLIAGELCDPVTMLPVEFSQGATT